MVEGGVGSGRETNGQENLFFFFYPKEFSVFNNRPKTKKKKKTEQKTRLFFFFFFGKRLRYRNSRVSSIFRRSPTDTQKRGNIKLSRFSNFFFFFFVIFREIVLFFFFIILSRTWPVWFSLFKRAYNCYGTRVRISRISAACSMQHSFCFLFSFLHAQRIYLTIHNRQHYHRRPISRHSLSNYARWLVANRRSCRKLFFKTLFVVRKQSPTLPLFPVAGRFFVYNTRAEKNNDIM